MKTELKLDPSKFNLGSLDQFFAEANQDSDPVSFWWLGNDEDSAAGAIAIIKGRLNANRARNVLAHNGLLNPDKPIVDLAASDSEHSVHSAEKSQPVRHELDRCGNPACGHRRRNHHYMIPYVCVEPGCKCEKFQEAELGLTAETRRRGVETEN